MPKSRLQMMMKFFTRKNFHLPDMDKFFKYSLQEPVIIDLGTKERKHLMYKWSLHPGKTHPPPRIHKRLPNIQLKIFFMLHIPFIKNNPHSERMQFLLSSAADQISFAILPLFTRLHIYIYIYIQEPPLKIEYIHTFLVIKGTVSQQQRTMLLYII